MKIRYQSKNRLWFEWDSSTPKEVFEQLAKLQEVFDISHCGCCQSTDIRFVVRENDGFQFYELRCNECHARLEFGQRREGGELFPKRKDESGVFRPNDGWFIYRGNDQREEKEEKKEVKKEVKEPVKEAAKETRKGKGQKELLASRGEAPF